MSDETAAAGGGLRQQGDARRGDFARLAKPEPSPQNESRAIKCAHDGARGRQDHGGRGGDDHDPWTAPADGGRQDNPSKGLFNL
jgi:hypothetical protein